MKKKMVSILTAAFCVSALLAGCGFADTAKTSASSAGAASSSADGTTTFTVGFDAEYPPYGYMDDETGDYTGFDLELAEAVCEIYGWKLVKTPINWDAKDTELNSGAIDCIWNGFTMNGREDDYTWSDPYVDNSQVMVVSENSGINSLSDLPKKYLDKHFKKVDDSHYAISPEIKKCVEFKKHNLLKDRYFQHIHMIVCRNVVIYFTDEAKDQVYENFHGALADDGILFIGSTEQILHAKELGFESLRTFFYKKMKI